MTPLVPPLRGEPYGNTAPPTDPLSLHTLTILEAFALRDPTLFTTEQLPGIAHTIRQTLVGLAKTGSMKPAPPAMPANSSALTCLECGITFARLSKHLRLRHHLLPDQYRNRWHLPPGTPLESPAEHHRRQAAGKASSPPTTTPNGP